MVTGFEAPTTRAAWLAFAVPASLLYVGFLAIVSRDPLYAVSMGITGGIGTTAVLAIAVGAWQRLRAIGG